MDESRPGMSIGGEPVFGREELEVVDPATSEVVARAPRCDEAACNAAVESAQRAFRPWSINETRPELMHACAARLRENATELGSILCTELGKPLGSAIEEAHIAAILLDAFADLPLGREQLAEAPARVELHRRPIGVVAAIAPWNWPLGLAMWKVAPALRAGNTVVLKPSPYTPLSTLRLGELLRDILPVGVLNVVSGDDDVGRMLVADPRVRKIGFTGSVATGKAIATAAAANLTRITLELGGNDAAIILEDADVDSITEPLFWAAFANTGQVCAAVKRLYVARPLMPKLVDALVARAEATRVGDPRDADTELGPIGNRRQLTRVEALRDGAVAAGGALLGRGRLDGPGHFFAPTIVTGVAEGVPIVDEEQFGPILPVLPFDDVDEVIIRANATEYGLGGSVWSADVERGAELAARLDCGTAWVNQHFAVHPTAPFGGRKQSGVGLENGLLGLHEYTEVQVVNVLLPKDDGTA